jgi:hypothetical protein
MLTTATDEEGEEDEDMPLCQFPREQLRVLEKLGHGEFGEVTEVERSRFDPRHRRKDFSSNLCVQTGSGAHAAYCTMGIGVPLPGAKARQGRDADHSPPSSAEVENE